MIFMAIQINNRIIIAFGQISGFRVYGFLAVLSGIGASNTLKQ